MVAYTSIQLLPKTRERLARLKAGTRATYDDLVNTLLDIVPEGDSEGRYRDDFRLGLVRARIGVLKGRVHSHADVKRSLGLEG